MDRASGKDKRGAGILLVSPEGEEIPYSLQFLFPATNNTAEYKTILGRLRLAHSLQAQRVSLYSDSQIVVNQVQGTFQTKDETLQKYLSIAKKFIGKLEYFRISCIPREENKKDGALSKLTSPSDIQIHIKEIKAPSINEALVGYVDEVEDNWTTPFKRYLGDGTLPPEKGEARRI